MKKSKKILEEYEEGRRGMKKFFIILLIK